MPTNVAVHANHIRKTLLSRNGSPTFRKILNALSNEELVQRDAEHHFLQVAHVAQRVEVRTELIVTPEMRLRAEKNNLRRRGANGYHSG